MTAVTAEIQSLLEAALKLPDDARAELAVILLDSIEDGSPPAEVEAAWSAEVERRREALRSGRAELFPSEDVERELEEIIAEVAEPRRAG